MFKALAYLQYHTIKNRTVARLKRLRQPKYLIGAIVGGAYFYFYFFRYLFGTGPRGGRFDFASSPDDLAFVHLVAGLILFIIMLAAWVLPNSRATLTFSEAEIAFLFPAPISRRGLIHYKLLRSQVGIFFTVLLLTLLTNRLGGKAWIHAAGWWLVLSTLNLHMLGASFARTMLFDRGIGNWQRRLTVLGIIGVVLGAAVLWTRQSMPALSEADFTDFASIREYVDTLLSSGPIYLLLLPFRVLAAPYLAPGPGAFFAALPGALLIIVLHYAWVVRFNVAFEEASLEASRRMAEKIAAVRSGNWHATEAKPVRAPFRLTPVGSPATALLWKNLIGAGRGFSSRLWIMIFAVCFGMAVGVNSSEVRGLPAALGMIAGIFLVWSLVIGPQILRQDFRQDLPMADLLKAYPVRGWQMAFGELLAPAIILTVIQAFLVLLAGLLLWGSSKTISLDWGDKLSIAAGAVLILPMLNLISLCIPNAAVLLFPAWFQAGKDAPQGIEATGQRLIAMLAQFLAFTFALVPPAIAFALVFFVGRDLIGLALSILLGSLAAGLLLGIEAALGTLMLGKLFDRYNVAEET